MEIENFLSGPEVKEKRVRELQTSWDSTQVSDLGWIMLRESFVRMCLKKAG